MSLEVGLEVGAGVWIRCPEQVWRPGDVVQLNGETALSGNVVVEARSTHGRTEKVEVQSINSKDGTSLLLLRNEDLKTREGARAAHDLARLTVLNEAEILHALQERFDSGVVYTSTGPILLAVNPFRELPDLYSQARLQEYVDLATDEDVVVPHIFSTSRAAYQGVQQHALPQTVLVSGESGAGKTETTKFVMRYLALAGVGCAEESLSKIEHQVLDSIPLLEALGNAKTLRNHNSSRFGKYIELHFASPPDSQVARLVGAHMRTYLLEKVRVTSLQKGERSYHIFYQVLAAAARESVSQKCVERGGDLKFGDTDLRGISGLQPQDFAYLRSSQCFSLAGGIREDHSRYSRSDPMPPRAFINQYLTPANGNTCQGDEEEAQNFDKVVEALSSLDIVGKDVTEVLSAIIAVLHIGNIAFKSPVAECSEVDEEEKSGSLGIACRLLGVSQKAFSSACCTKTRTTRDGLIRSPISVAKAVESRDALARHLYGAIFAHIVMQVNIALKVTGNLEKGFSALPFVGVLDIFGFEFFELNSFEQLCINYTNELLQQYFNEVIFEHEESLYTREGIQWDPLDFPNNSAIVNMIGKANSGILPMLDEECMTIGGNSQQWCDKLRKAHATNNHFKVVRQRQANFIVQHFAGPVEYNCKEFVEKNRDILSADLVQCMQASENSFIQQRFLEHDRVFGTQESSETTSGARRVTKARQYSVSGEFRKQLQDLMERIRSTEPHFVRCIKPNPRCVPHEFNRKSVVEQLQYQGVLQAIEVSRAGFPMRLRHRQAVLEFRCLAPSQTKIQVEAQIARGKLDMAARLLFRGLGDGAVPGLVDGSWAVGKTLVFLKKNGIEVISSALLKLRHKTATRIEAAWRCSRSRRKYTRCRRNAIRIQAVARGLLAKRKADGLRKRHSAVLLQSAERGRQVRYEIRKWRKAAMAIQAIQHGRILRKKFLRSLRSLRLLQCWLRHYLRRQIERRRWQSAVRLQRTWRGNRGRLLATLALADWQRLRFACRRLLAHWRCKVSLRLLSPRHVEQRVREGRPGHLYAAAIALQDQYVRGAAEVHLLQFERELLNQQVMEMQRWTLRGGINQLWWLFFGGACEEQDCSHQAAAPESVSRHSDDSRVDSDFEMWLVERRLHGSPRAPFVLQTDTLTSSALAGSKRELEGAGWFDSFFCCADRQYAPL